MDNTQQLERDIFGGSDSELSSEGEQKQHRSLKSGSKSKTPRSQTQIRPQIRAPPQRRSRSFSPIEPPSSDDDDGGDNEAKDSSYVSDLRAALPKFKKGGSKRGDRDRDRERERDREDRDGEGDGDAEKERTDVMPRRRRSKKSLTQEIRDEARDGEDDVPLDPEQLRKKELESRIDSAGKLGRTRPKKRKKGDEDALYEAHDSVVRRLGLAMKSAADEDQLANASRQPATAKLRMLPEVMQVLQPTQLSQAIIDGNLLELVKIWLEPLPDKSLPALNIQHSFFEVLPKMDIDTVALKESGLGRIVLFYTKPNKRVTAPIKRAADSLVAQWSRPIIKRSASYRDRVIPTANIDSSTADRRPLKLNQVLQKQREEEAAAGIVKRNAVRIPERNVATYTVAPRNAVSSGMSVRMMEDMKSRKAQNDRARKIHRHLTQHAAKLHKQ